LAGFGLSGLSEMYPGYLTAGKAQADLTSAQVDQAGLTAFGRAIRAAQLGTQGTPASVAGTSFGGNPPPGPSGQPETYAGMSSMPAIGAPPMFGPPAPVPPMGPTGTLPIQPGGPGAGGVPAPSAPPVGAPGPMPPSSGGPSPGYPAPALGPASGGFQGGGAPAPSGGQSGGMDMGLQAIIRSIVQANPGAPPEVLASAVNHAIPLMNAEALQQWRQLQGTLGYYKTDVASQDRQAAIAAANQRAADANATRLSIAQSNIISHEHIANMNNATKSAISQQVIAQRDRAIDGRRQTALDIEAARNQNREILQAKKANDMQALERLREENREALARIHGDISRDLEDQKQQGREDIQMDRDAAAELRLDKTLEERDKARRDTIEARQKAAEQLAKNRKELEEYKEGGRQTRFEQTETRKGSEFERSQGLKEQKEGFEERFRPAVEARKAAEGATRAQQGQQRIDQGQQRVDIARGRETRLADQYNRTAKFRDEKLSLATEASRVRFQQTQNAQDLKDWEAKTREEDRTIRARINADNMTTDADKKQLLEDLDAIHRENQKEFDQLRKAKPAGGLKPMTDTMKKAYQEGLKKGYKPDEMKAYLKEQGYDASGIK
jgi:hypothetical protein